MVQEKARLRVLFLEDSEDDFIILLREFQKSNYQIVFERVSSKQSFYSAIESLQWDVIISDYKLPGFSALAALQYVKKHAGDIPFIIVSGEIGDETAVKAMKAGVHDYIMKENLARLVPAVEREVKEFEERRNRRQAEENFRISELRFKSIFENHNSVMLMIDAATGDLLDSNRAAISFYGYPLSELTGKSITELTVNPPENMLELLGNTSSTPDTPHLFTHRLASGERRYVEVYATLIKHPTRILFTIIHDVTQRYIAENELKSTLEILQIRNDELDNFSYKISHDLRAPLCSVRGLINVIKLGVGSDEMPVYIDMIENRVSKLDRFILDILSHSKNLNAPVEYERVNLKAVVDSCYEELKYLPGSEQVGVKVVADAATPFVSDKLRITNIIKNLLSNSIKYRNRENRNHEVYIRLKHTGQIVELLYKDNGTGIEKKMLPRIFDMFFRGNDIAEGAGIGLYIVKRAVEKLDGQIKVESMHNVGTTFTISLPGLDLSEGI